ncbi:ras-related protein Rab-37 isoform X2 [Hyalella azteca]|uniref:Ras-related protein Rab-37 isoform X2 n=1 Tax=Hyalella azteca TaxID=294128 RepID=A0A8B7NTM7_HYAAZ|nr:ras-related protein Rab-37 isoform X2 [Hyalella azteca]
MWGGRKRKEDRRNSASVVELQRAAKLAQSRLANCDKSPGLRRANSYKENEMGMHRSPSYLKPPYPNYYEPDSRNISAGSSETSIKLHGSRERFSPCASPKMSRLVARRLSGSPHSSLSNISHNGREHRSVKDLRHCEALASNDDGYEVDKRRRGSGSPRHMSLTGIPEDMRVGRLNETDSLFSDNSSLASYRTCDYFFKVMLIGDSGVGKTCLVTKFRDGVFLSGSFIATVGLDYKNKTLRVDGSLVRLQLWDTAGQERFRSLTRSHYKDVQALMLLYDVHNRRSFSSVRNWVVEARRLSKRDVVILLVGNKSDYSESDRAVTKDEGLLLAKELGLNFVETSAKNGDNVELAFRAVAVKLKCQHSADPEDKSFSLQDYLLRNEASWWSSCCSFCPFYRR